ncbi:MAG: carbon monoxide dehydrogenase subunit G [Ardenticatenales bacterium]|nr:carbon monoxide dehydrogenase subunit G [Ardenticatenales bacterium]
MRIEGEYTFRAPCEVVFDLLQNPDALSKAMPGATQLVKIGEDSYEAQMTVKIGSINGTYAGTIAVQESQRPEHFRLLVEGKGAAGFLKGEGTVDLEPSAEGTLIHYAGETQVGGRIAQVGQRLVEAVARKVINQGLQSLENQLAASPESEQE